MSGRGEPKGSGQEARAHAALAEGDAALVCLQVGSVTQASWHVERSERALAGRELSAAAGSEEEQTLEGLAHDQGLAGRRVAAARLRRLMGELGALPDGAGLNRPGWLDRLGRRGRAGFILVLVLIAGAMCLYRTELSQAEQSAMGGRRSTGGAPRVRITLDALRTRYLGQPFSHLLKGIPFKEQAEVLLDRRRPVFKMKIALLNSQIYRVSLLLGGKVVHRYYLGPRTVPWGMCRYSVDLQHTATPAGVDRILVEGVDGEGDFELGPVELLDGHERR